jgi:pilus assembly protein CpaB
MGGHVSLRTLIIMVSALACAGIAAVGVNQVLSGAGTSSASVKAVIVAKVEIPRGTTITAEFIESRPYPKGMLPEGTIASPADAVGRTVMNHLVKGELLLDAKLAPKGAKGGIASLIPPGMRAIAIQIPNVATGVGGFVLPGNRVDVLVTMNDDQREIRGNLSTLTLLENVEIIAVDARIDAPAENKVDAKEMRSVTLICSPEQAARLNLGMNKGTLHLSLRNPTDDKTKDPRPAVMADIRPPAPAPPKVVAKAEPAVKPAPASPPPAPVAAAAPAPAPKPVPPGIRVIRDTQESIVRFHQG